jgi:hypothetical protein
MGLGCRANVEGESGAHDTASGDGLRLDASF